MFPNENGIDFTNLLEWVTGELEKVQSIAQEGRIRSYVSKWIDKGNDNVFCIVEDTLIHKSSLRLRGNDEHDICITGARCSKPER